MSDSTLPNNESTREDEKKAKKIIREEEGKKSARMALLETLADPIAVKQQLEENEKIRLNRQAERKRVNRKRERAESIGQSPLEFCEVFTGNMGSLDYGTLRLADSSLVFKNDRGGKSINLTGSDIYEVEWQKYNEKPGLKVVLTDSMIHQFGGLKTSDFYKIGKFVQAQWSKSIINREGMQKGMKDPNMPSKPLSAYKYWIKEAAPALRKEGDKSTDYFRKAGAEWNKMSSADKKEWVEKAAVDKARYKLEMKAYRKGIRGSTTTTASSSSSHSTTKQESGPSPSDEDKTPKDENPDEEEEDKEFD